MLRILLLKSQVKVLSDALSSALCGQSPDDPDVNFLSRFNESLLEGLKGKTTLSSFVTESVSDEELKKSEEALKQWWAEGMKDKN